MGFKSLDFFQKISMDNVTKPTIIGSILSLSAISLMIFLLIRQIIDLTTPHSITDSIVEQPENSDEQISINLNVEFPYVPCHIIALDTVDIVNNHRGDISDTLKKYRLFSKEKNKDPELFNSDHSIGGLTKAIEENEGCILIGTIGINQVPGEFHVSFHRYRGLWNLLNNQRRDLANKVKMTHFIKTMNFGKTQQEYLEKFGLKREYFFSQSLENIMRENKNERDLVYNYFIKIIPHKLIDENKGTTEYSYSFSMSHKKADLNPSRDEMPIATFEYQFSPIMMKITHLKRNYLHFLTHVSAIVGGVFVVFNLLNNLLTNLMDTDDKK